MQEDLRVLPRMMKMGGLNTQKKRKIIGEKVCISVSYPVGLTMLEESVSGVVLFPQKAAERVKSKPGDVASVKFT